MTPSSSFHSDRDAPPSATLVGRERDLVRCQNLFQQMLAGHGQALLISGEAGIGKTTLINAAIAPLPPEALHVLTGHCYDLSVTPPYGPWREILREAHGQAGTALPDALAGTTSALSLSSQQVLFDAVLTDFHDLAAHRPLVLILEDIHWADQASLELLRAVFRDITARRILVVATYRDDEITRRHPLFQLLPVLVREGPVERLQLRRLDVDQIHTMIAARYPLPPHDCDRLTGYLARLSDGNPFFIQELLITLEHERILRLEPGTVSLHGLVSIRTPPLLRQVIARRLAHLDQTTRDALEVAAIIGQEVPLEVWQTVMQATDDDLDAAVRDAMESRVLEELSSESEVRFTHALLREALYEDIAPTRRRRWHRRVAETLTSMPMPDPDSVAYHFQQVGDARAIDWLIRAGERAQRAHAWFTSADRFEAAIRLLESLPERDRERGWLLYRVSQLRRYSNQHQNIAYLDEALEIASLCGDDELVAAVLQGRGLLKCFGGDLESGLPELEAGIAAAERLGIQAGGSIRPGTALNRGTYAMWLAFAGRFNDAIVVAEEHLSRQVVSEGPGAHRALGVAYSFLGQPEQARKALRRSLEIAVAAHDPPNAYAALTQELKFAVLPYHTDNLIERERLTAEADLLLDRASGSTGPLPEQHAFSVELLLLTDRWDEARNLVDDSELWLSSGIGERLHLMYTAIFAHHQGHANGSWCRIHELLPDGPPIPPGTASSYLEVVLLLHLVAQPGFEQADLKIARAWLDAFDRWLEWSGSVLGRAENAVLWAHYHQAAGDLTQARDHAERALTFAGNPRQPLALSAAHRTMGQLETVAGRFDEAERHVQEALILADACAVPFERALVMLAQAMVQIASGDTDGARAALHEVVRICERLSARPLLERAEAVLATLVAETPTRGSQRGLSTREIEVLHLVAQGMTDREIAAALFISPRTVTTHVTHILNKLGVTTRTEAATAAIREGLI